VLWSGRESDHEWVLRYGLATCDLDGAFLDLRTIAKPYFQAAWLWKRGKPCSHQLSTGRPIFHIEIRNPNAPFASLSTRWESDVSVCPGAQQLQPDIPAETRKPFHRSN
jgi:hypothetical protein